MTAALPEPWLRGPVPGIPPLLMPAAHALLLAREDIDRAIEGLTTEQLWAMPGGAASIGYHLGHLTGSTDRLLTYARGEALSTLQMATLTAERLLCESCPSLDHLVVDWHRAVDTALLQFRETPEDTLLDPRGVGRAQLPTTVLGLLVHVGEHAARHTGQIVTTARVVRSLHPAPRGG